MNNLPKVATQWNSGATPEYELGVLLFGTQCTSSIY